jgi:hypothetical protein
VEPHQNGKFIVIDVESGDYEIEEGELDAHGRLRSIPVLEASGPPLIGTPLLTGSQLNTQFRNGGAALIEEL